VPAQQKLDQHANFLFSKQYKVDSYRNWMPCSSCEMFVRLQSECRSTQHSTAQHSAAQHSAAQHSIPASLFSSQRHAAILHLRRNQEVSVQTAAERT